MALQQRTRDRNGTREAYEGPRPMPDEAPLEPAATGPVPDDAAGASWLNVIAGIWLIISPFVLGYTNGDSYWNPIVFGAVVAIIALGRLAGGYRSAPLSWINMAVGVWLFISAWWLAQSSQAIWNDWILGVIVFVLGAFGASAAPIRSRRATL